MHEDLSQPVSPTTQRLEAAAAAAAAAGMPPELQPVRLPVTPGPTLLHQQKVCARAVRGAATVADGPELEGWTFEGKEGERMLMGMRGGDKSMSLSPVAAHRRLSRPAQYASTPEREAAWMTIREKRGLKSLSLDTLESTDKRGRYNGSRGAKLSKADVRSGSTLAAAQKTTRGTTRRQPSKVMRLLAGGCLTLCAAGAAALGGAAASHNHRRR